MHVNAIEHVCNQHAARRDRDQWVELGIKPGELVVGAGASASLAGSIDQVPQLSQFRLVLVRSAHGRNPRVLGRGVLLAVMAGVSEVGRSYRIHPPISIDPLLRGMHRPGVVGDPIGSVIAQRTEEASHQRVAVRALVNAGDSVSVASTQVGSSYRCRGSWAPRHTGY
jgi:hypothetical protein